ncbi:unnamed protein product [Triticum turgidum subsp. durum]|uniref:F-box domain-containing protein n=2 Tax=Triticum TaxID=4564 RepID=A0A9R0QBT6_TRITD|nr:unnamed protein product [Triticum turgidum subsp. durum]
MPMSETELVRSALTVKVYQMDHGSSPTKICKSVVDEDIISNLPEALRDKILCCLPIKEAVGTCLLSRTWRYTWASMTELMFRTADFASGNDSADDDRRFLKFTDMFLFLHNGPILKFCLNTVANEMVSTGGHLYRWMLMLSRNKIKEIQLQTSIRDSYKVPSSFFSCDELEYVYLRACVFTSLHLPPPSKGFKQLHTLRLEYVTVEGNSLGDLVASCPNLEKLNIRGLCSQSNINIRSTKLKVLKIEGWFTHLNLHAPYLTSVWIGLELNSDTDGASTTRCNFNLSPFIASLSDVETIRFHGHILERVEHEFLILKQPKLFNRLTEISLEINLGDLKEANFALCLFQHAPNLRFVKLKLISRNSAGPTVHFWESIDRDVCLFQNVEVLGLFDFTGSVAELGFLKFLLEGAPVLRKLGIIDKGLDRNVLKYLLKLRRTSKDAELLIL